MNTAFRLRRQGWHLAWIALLAGGLAWMLADAANQRAAQRERSPHVQSVVRLLGVADLALSSSSRWLRHPSITEPGAAFADGPAILDNPPAGAVLGPAYAVPASHEKRWLGPASPGGAQ